MNITENNKLIAEFLTKNTDYWQVEDSQQPEEEQLYFQPHDAEFQLMHPSEMLFSTSWNWLMPVIQKCLEGEAEQSPEISNTVIKSIYNALCNTEITEVYQSVVAFIKWYNEQNPN